MNARVFNLEKGRLLWYYFLDTVIVGFPWKGVPNDGKEKRFQRQNIKDR